MVMTDPIADMLTRIRNANMVYNKQVDIPLSKMKIEIAKILKKEGYITDYKVMQDSIQGTLRCYLKYGSEQEKIIHGIKKASTPGRRIYRRAKEIPVVLNKIGIAIVSTSRGLMTGEDAKEQNLGGELICTVW